MARINFVSRSDDLGSSDSANRAIAAVVKSGFIRNVSVMAPGPKVEDAARLLAHRKDVCFGMHTTLNAEWDRVKWGPVSPLSQCNGLVDAAGWFLADPSRFAQTKPAVETVMREVDAQLEKLHALGFDIRYIDSHMFPEMYIDGLDEAMAAFAKRKGLVDHMYFYNLPSDLASLQGGLSGLVKGLRSLPTGQYFLVTHPALDTDEMRMTGNAQYSGEDIARGRAAETAIYANPLLRPMLRLLGCAGVRYDEATPQTRATVDSIRNMLSSTSQE